MSGLSGDLSLIVKVLASFAVILSMQLSASDRARRARPSA